MATAAAAQPAFDRYRPVAGPVHTVLLLVAVTLWTIRGAIKINHMRAAAHPQHVPTYLLTILFEWLLVAFIVVGVRRTGAPLAIILGDRWRSVRQVFRDIGIALAFWIASGILLGILVWLLGLVGARQNLQFLFPDGVAEIALWIALSVTAGICEEIIFRGYLQRQFVALTKSVPAGVVLSGLVFGAAHAYQGFRMTIVLACYGMMFGLLAHWRDTVRPGMIAHAWQDSLSGLLSRLLTQ